MGADGVVIGLNARIEPSFTQNWVEVLSAGADSRAVEDMVTGPIDYPFTLIFTPVDFWFLKYLGFAVADAGSSPYTHTFTLSNSLQSFKLEWALQHTTDVVVTLTGCFALNARLDFSKATGANEGLLTVTINCNAKSHSLGSSVTSLSSITRVPYKWHHLKFTFNNSEVTEINSGSLEINTGIDPNESRYCNSTLARERGEPILGTHRITGNANINLSDNTYFDKWDDATTVSNCKLEVIEDNTDNKLVATFASFRFDNPINATELEQVSKADIQFTDESFTSLVATDTQSTYN